MALKTNKKDEETRAYEIKVLRRHDLKDSIAFDMEANGVKIYGCFYRTYENDKGEDVGFVSFPSRKGSDGKYYSYAWFRVTSEILAEIEKQLQALEK